MLQKISISNRCCSSECYIHQRNLKKKRIMVFTKILSSATVFKTDSNKMFFEYQISILKSLLKIHVTLKTRIMAAENIIKYIKNFFFRLLVIFHKIKILLYLLHKRLLSVMNLADPIPYGSV